ncbi:MAG: hypothetical protein V2I50_06530 [Desulfuromusa sp.]|jgi:hypothetical protein|nr:hypothetical protein [Desulfuromusa sp.]
MAEQRDESPLMYQEIKIFTDKIRSLLCDQNPTPSLLESSVSAADIFKENVSAINADTFLSIIERVANIPKRHLAAGTLPTKLEIETIELASDWLEQLIVLHKEDLPEPKSLVAELLYTFDLVERSQEAVTLAELVASRFETGKKNGVDPFSDDPEFEVQEREASSHLDPFAEDPGFGLEFDLLQRTINFVVETEQIDDDPFNADPALNFQENEAANMEVTPAPVTSSYDIFADDPPPVDE